MEAVADVIVATEAVARVAVAAETVAKVVVVALEAVANVVALGAVANVVVALWDILTVWMLRIVRIHIDCRLRHAYFKYSLQTKAGFFLLLVGKAWP